MGFIYRNSFELNKIAKNKNYYSQRKIEKTRTYPQ